MEENTITFSVQLDTVCFTKKPARDDIRSMKPRLATQQETQCTPEQFAEAVLQGKAYNPGILQGGAKAENWTKQQLYCLDIDNKEAENFPEKLLTPEQALERCRENNILPFLIYSTFSSTPELPKFRICFCADSCTTDTLQREHIQLGLMALFPECDPACKNADRLYFGGREVLHMDSVAVFSASAAEDIHAMVRSIECQNTRAVNRTRNLDGGIHEKAKAFDLLSYVLNHFPTEKQRRCGKCIGINPCPVCGHNDDFYIYPDSGTFTCFGGSSPRSSDGKQPGGTIIDLLQHTRHTGKKQAVQAFQCEILGMDLQEANADYQKRKMLDAFGTQHPDEQATELPPYIYPKCDKNGEFIRYEVSCPKLADHFRQNHAYFWLNTNGTRPPRYLYQNGVYKPVTDEQIKNILRGYIEAFDPELVKTKLLDETAKLLFLDDVTVQPAALNTCETLVNFQNGLLKLDTMEFMPHSNGEYMTVQLPLSWNPYAYRQHGASVFESYLNTLTGGDESKEHFLLQWMGCILSNIRGDVVKKAVFLYGKGDTGKSQLLRLCQMLLGNENICSTSLQSLESSRFGTFAMYGKRLTLDPDMSFAKVTEMSNFKKGSGGDPLQFEQKNRDPFTDTYKGFMWFAMNELPKFGGDHGDHVYKRIVPIYCGNVIPEQEKDPMLVEKLYSEREAILCLCMEAARTVLQNGHKFDLPNDTAAELEQYKQENSCVRQFFVECCVYRDSCKDGIGTSELNQAFNNWVVAEGDGYKLTPQQFKLEVANYLAVPAKQVRRKYHGKWFYPLTLQEPAKRVYGAYLTPSA